MTDNSMVPIIKIKARYTSVVLAIKKNKYNHFTIVKIENRYQHGSYSENRNQIPPWFIQ
jgi:hypothetical protein